MKRCPTVYPAHCVVYTGPDIPELGIVKGESTLEDLFDVLVSQSAGSSVQSRLDQLDDTIENLSSSAILANAQLFGLGSNKSICGANIEDVKYDYTLTPNSTTLQFDWDASSVERNLPADYKVISKSVRALSGKTKSTVISGSGMVGTFQIKTDRLPVTVKMEYLLDTPCGNMELISSVSLPTVQSGNYKGMLQVSDLSAGERSILSVKEFLELIAAEMTVVKREVFEKPSIPPPALPEKEESTTSSEVTQLKSDLADAKKEIDILRARLDRLAS